VERTHNDRPRSLRQSRLRARLRLRARNVLVDIVQNSKRKVESPAVTKRINSQEDCAVETRGLPSVLARDLPIVGHGHGDGDGHGFKGGRISSSVESGGVLGLTGNCVGRRQRVEGHPLVKRVKATLTADNNYALAA